MEYVKLENGTLERLLKVPHVSNPREKTVASYAAANGYKPLIRAEYPCGLFREKQYIDLGDSIAETCEPIDLETAKVKAMEYIQQQKDEEINKKTKLACSLGWAIEYTPSAVQDACAIIIMMNVGVMEVTSWTDADNVRHDGLTLEDMKEISRAIASHKRWIQDKADEARSAVNAAQSVEELETLTIDFQRLS